MFMMDSAQRWSDAVDLERQAPSHSSIYYPPVCAIDQGKLPAMCCTLINSVTLHTYELPSWSEEALEDGYFVAGGDH